MLFVFLEGVPMNLFVWQLLELSGKGIFLGIRLVGKFGLAYTLSRMLLERGLGFSLEKSFPYPYL